MNPPCSDCDVLVVGGGPAGSSAARAAAKLGARVLVAESRQRIGVPVQCAEYVPAMLLGTLGLQTRDFVVQPVEGMLTYLPGREPKLTRTPGHIIRRDRLDLALADAAADAGAWFRMGWRAVAREADGSVRLRDKKGEEMHVTARVIIGADGPRSKVAEWVGSPNRHLLPGVQLTLPLVEPLTHTEIYFAPEIVAGYGWLFPKGEVANVGLGMVPVEHGHRIRQLLVEFAARLADAGKVRLGAKGSAAGWIPAEAPRPAVHGDVALVGDAAGQTHPITGAGIFAAVTCGEMAGRWAARAAQARDIALLSGYEEEWRELLGGSLERAHARRVVMESRWDQFDEIIESCWVAYRAYYAASD